MKLEDYLNKMGPAAVKRFSEQVGVSESQIYHILNGRRKPSRRLAERIELETKRKVKKESLLWDQAS